MLTLQQPRINKCLISVTLFVYFQNLLNNFRNSDLMSCVARFFLFAQMVTVFPLLMYILRAQSLSFIFGDTYPRSGCGHCKQRSARYASQWSVLHHFHIP